jgi:hypothetical protein
LYDKINEIDLQNGAGSGTNSNSSFENETYSSLTDDNALVAEMMSPGASVRDGPSAVSLFHF